MCLPGSLDNEQRGILTLSQRFWDMKGSESHRVALGIICTLFCHSEEPLPSPSANVPGVLLLLIADSSLARAYLGSSWQNNEDANLCLFPMALQSLLIIALLLDSFFLPGRQEQYTWVGGNHKSCPPERGFGDRVQRRAHQA